MGQGRIKCLTFHSTRTGAIKLRQPVNSDVRPWIADSATNPIVGQPAMMSKRKNSDHGLVNLKVDGVGIQLHDEAPNAVIPEGPTFRVFSDEIKYGKDFRAERVRRLGASFLIPTKRSTHIPLGTGRDLDLESHYSELSHERNSSSGIAIVRPVLMSSLRLRASATPAFVISSSSVASPCRLSTRDSATTERSSGASAKASSRT